MSNSKAPIIRPSENSENYTVATEPSKFNSMKELDFEERARYKSFVSKSQKIYTCSPEQRKLLDSLLEEERQAHEQTKAQLHALEDALRDRQDVPIRAYKDTGYYRQKEIDKLFNQAIQNSRSRNNEGTL